jgi:magnesium-transporting ATPase (P-type)
MRKILHATERVTVNSGEIFLFIGILLLFALASSSVVLWVGLSDPNRNRFKVILHCIMIVTSVVPPELPMELSLAVTNSLSALARELIFCTEPYRIPLAGRVSMICFDKTGTHPRRSMKLSELIGTLTQDRMILRGVSDPQRADCLDNLSDSERTDALLLDELEKTSVPTLTDVEDCSSGVLLGMACCQSLLHTGNGEVLGERLDPVTVLTPLAR